MSECVKPLTVLSCSQTSGVALVVLATACYGLSVNIATPIQQKYGSLPVTMWMLSLASLFTAPCVFCGSRRALALALALALAISLS